MLTKCRGHQSGHSSACKTLLKVALSKFATALTYASRHDGLRERGGTLLIRSLVSRWRSIVNFMPHSLSP